MIGIPMVCEHEGLRETLHEDDAVRMFLRENLKAAGIGTIEIKRPAKMLKLPFILHAQV